MEMPFYRKKVQYQEVYMINFTNYFMLEKLNTFDWDALKTIFKNGTSAYN